MVRERMPSAQSTFGSKVPIHLNQLLLFSLTFYETFRSACAQMTSRQMFQMMRMYSIPTQIIEFTIFNWAHAQRQHLWLAFEFTLYLLRNQTCSELGFLFAGWTKIKISFDLTLDVDKLRLRIINIIISAESHNFNTRVLGMKNMFIGPRHKKTIELLSFSMFLPLSSRFFLCTCDCVTKCVSNGR